ncbi:MAG: DUF393 domain-containing protein [Bacteroidales bacterium]|nr:DUF393 domain-containing protein [Bacteroidales bacterium]MBN2819290.1 DUF393 domain-containing protein [Bacteroidales bacterium]
MDLLLIDDTCTLCNKTVAFLSLRGGDNLFQYISLFSPQGQELLKNYGFPSDYDKSVVLIRNQKAYIKSDAALRIFRQLPGIIRFLYVFVVIPKFIRDWVYDIVAKHRHGLF